MPAIRPEAISNRIRLTYEVGTAVSALVPERGTVDALLSFACALVNRVIEKLPPHEERIPCKRPKDNVFAWTDELRLPPPICIHPPRVVPFVKRETCPIAVLCQPPQAFHSGERRQEPDRRERAHPNVRSHHRTSRITMPCWASTSFFFNRYVGNLRVIGDFTSSTTSFHSHSKPRCHGSIS